MAKKPNHRSFQTAKDTEGGSRATSEPKVSRLRSDPSLSVDVLEGVKNNSTDSGSPLSHDEQTGLDPAAAEDHASSPRPKSAGAIRREQRRLKKQRRRRLRRQINKRDKQRRRQRADEMAPELSKQSLQKADKAEAAKK